MRRILTLTPNSNLKESPAPLATCGNIAVLVLPKPKRPQLQSTLPACPTMEEFKGLHILRRLSFAKIATNSTRKIQSWSMANRYKIPTKNGKTAYGGKAKPLAKIAICRAEDISGRASTTRNG